MPLKSTAVTVTTTAAIIADGTPGTASVPVSVIIEVPAGGVAVYLGGSDVSTANGLAVTPTASAAAYSPAFDLIGPDQLWAVAGGSQSINVLRTRQ